MEEKWWYKGQIEKATTRHKSANQDIKVESVQYIVKQIRTQYSFHVTPTTNENTATFQIAGNVHGKSSDYVTIYFEISQVSRGINSNAIMIGKNCDVCQI